MSGAELGIAEKLVPDRQRRIPRAEPHGIADMLDALLRLSETRQRVTDMGVGAGGAGIELDRLLEM